MMKKFLSVSVLGVMALYLSCTKEYNERVCDTPSNINQFCDTLGSKVTVRPINNTEWPLCNFRVTFIGNQPDTFKYGVMQPLDSGCFVVLDQVKRYPIVKFRLGVREFQIVDSLRNPNFTYQGLIFNDPGFYDLVVQIAGSLDTGIVVTNWRKHN